MTEAESRLIDALLSAKGLRIATEGMDTLDVGDALCAVAEERVHPEAKAKFDTLLKRYRVAQKELYAFTDSLPNAIALKWWNEPEEQ